ncbi:hypothetical protein ISF_02409 [Cordyceps fumosorosea ARSEF 2679]|uniref:Phosphatidylglycerol lysyltransferase C-terminal domain-containing protein n=1 Tax=Cordyceps fumosorosea (strain ARSEF 2679) TaxID=1081104 RepID=A0A168BQW4_CORFA|nr:hypothetical protein ISF_02409 [Cordyceps fumosorosea ARSEF 2679]OAA70435.1 hypothetical protein ISF_02409 [Cordyceps fumosorosea ARSEF 2679]
MQTSYLYPEAASTASSSISGMSTRSCALIDTVYAAASTNDGPRVCGLPNLSFRCRPKNTCPRLSMDTHTTGGGSSSSSSSNSSFHDYPSSTRTSESRDSSCTSHDFDTSYHRFSRTAHMGILDPSYKRFVSQHGHGSLVYKARSGAAVVAGDPLCAPDQVESLLDEFRRFRGDRRLRVVYVGASAAFAERSQREGCVTMHFGRERVLNPLTNPLLKNKAGKRTISQCRQLLDAARGGVSVGIYAPGVNGYDPELELELQAVYDGWRAQRDSSRPTSAQAFITRYDLFSRPDVTMFLYTCDRDGRANGIAGLRYLGANNGFQLDPCVASDDAPRGITDLLVVSAMQLLRNSGVSYLSLGFEPYGELKDVTGRDGWLAKLTRDGYRRVMGSIKASGKQTHNDKLRPDEDQESGLYIILPRGLLHLREISALIKVTNVDVTSLFSRKEV